MSDQPILDALRRHARERPDAPVIVAGDETLSYGALARRVARAADELRALGVQTGDRVLLRMAAGCPDAPSLYLGTLASGGVAVPVDDASSTGDLQKLVDRTQPVVVARSGEPLDKAHRRLAAPVTPAPPADLAEILFSSGTTGRPKGVMLTHTNIAASAAAIARVIGNGPGDREVVTVPLTHSFGLGRLRSLVLMGGAAEFVPGLTFPGVALAALKGATGLACVPAGLALLRAACGDDLTRVAPALRYLELGSAPMTTLDKKALAARLPGVRLWMHYGLTEASRSAFLRLDDPDAALESVGRATPGTELTVRGLHGSASTIHVRGPTVTPGYWRDGELTASRLGRDGWLDTGDLGALDADGWLMLTGRADDQINVGGETVSPVPVERAAEAHAQVEEAACVGVPDRLLGQVPRLYIVVRGGKVPTDLMRHIAGQVSASAVPRTISAVERLPHTASGKLKRAELRTG